MRLIDTWSHGSVPGLTRRLLLAVLATLAPAVAASPAGAAGHAIRTAQPNPNVGIVDIYTTLGYENGEAAGTGMILSRTGEVLTNNHVIRGATTFQVVDVTTKKRYPATVVGYSVSQDIAVLQLAHASGLRTIKLGNSVPVRVGQTVVARGNAQGLAAPRGRHAAGSSPSTARSWRETRRATPRPCTT
jgi:S1-C subfamily serine protease